MRIRGAVLLLLLASRLASADDSDETPVQVHGFASQGALLTTDNNYLADTKHGSLEFAEAGINFTKQLDDRLSVGIQLFARDLGPNSNYNAQFDWLYLDYHWKDWLGLRAGRVKLPFGLYNDTSDIDAAQPVVLLPQSVYPVADRQFLLAQTGVELYGYRPLGAAGALDYHAYLGTLSFSIPSSAATTVDQIEVPYITGGRVLWETPLEGLRVGASLLAGKVDGTFTTSVTTMGMTSEVVTALSLVQTQPLASIEYQSGGVLLAAEYGRTYITETVTSMPTLHRTSEVGYGLASYRWHPWLQTTAYYSALYPDVDHRSGAANVQHDAAVSVRFDITSHWLCKLETHFMRGTAGLTPALNDNTPVANLADQWWLIAAKTTVYF